MSKLRQVPTSSEYTKTPPRREARSLKSTNSLPAASPPEIEAGGAPASESRLQVSELRS